MSIVSGVGGSGTFSSASGGKVYAYNDLNATTARSVAPANQARKKVIFHNPGDVDILIFPALQQTSGSNTALPVTTAAKGGAFLVFANGGTLEITGECQGEWMGLAVSGTTKPCTVMDTNV